MDNGLYRDRLWKLLVEGGNRGIEQAACDVGTDVYERAALSLLSNDDAIVIGTGFPVGGAPETDGPPGAIVLAEALQRLKKRVVIATYSPLVAILRRAALKLNVSILRQEYPKK